MDPEAIQGLAEKLASCEPQEVLASALDTFSPRISISFSGAEDVVLIDMASQLGKPFRVFSLDTGRLHPATYEFLEQVQDHYSIKVEFFFPQAAEVQKLVGEKGLFSFYRDGHAECCSIRKVEPLRRALVGLAAWVTGQRRDQNPATREHLSVVELDPISSHPGQGLVKFNPLANWGSRQVWDYIREYNVPYNPLHERGYVSIGCQPCTRPIHPGQHEREGRWWWEESTKKECGLHSRMEETKAHPRCDESGSA